MAFKKDLEQQSRMNEGSNSIPSEQRQTGSPVSLMSARGFFSSAVGVVSLSLTPMVNGDSTPTPPPSVQDVGFRLFIILTPFVLLGAAAIAAVLITACLKYGGCLKSNNTDDDEIGDSDVEISHGTSLASSYNTMGSGHG